MLDYADIDRRKANPTRWERPRAMPLFDGETFEPKHDETRLTGQLAKVYDCMRDQNWRTLSEMKIAIDGGSEAGISARLRDLRKEKWGSHRVNRRRRGDAKRGVFEYQVIVNRPRVTP